MCGIVGYAGCREAVSIVVGGLRRLEYRGYDSAGIAVHGEGGLRVARAVGKLARLDEVLGRTPLTGSVAVGHTRWATHGRPSEANAHPHVAGRVAVVHNGIIENHAALKRGLSGAEFRSETDTEVIAHLVDRELARGGKLAAAVVRVAGVLEGTYALAVVAESEPDVIVVAKRGSPLVVGLGEGEAFCASDVPALLAHTRDVAFLEDGDVAVLSSAGIDFVAGGPRTIKRIAWDATQAERGGFKHFMLKEIHEQPSAVESTLLGNAGTELPGDIGRVCLVACGTSHHAALVGRHWIEGVARLPCQAELASEFRYREPVFLPGDLIVAVSQSGETADTLAAARYARESGARVMAVANVVDSAIPRASDAVLYTHAGPEIGVASTKCFTAQMAALLLFAARLGRRDDVVEALRRVPEQMRQVLNNEGKIVNIARRLARSRHVLFLGRGLSYPIALEGALKLKEISYIHAEGYAAGEMKHGPIALIDDDVPVVVVCPRDRHHAKTLSNIAEVRARGGRVVAVTTEGDADVAELAHYVIEVPVADELVQPLLTVLPLQLLAYHVAAIRGTDVDQPRNLAKTVTVE